MLPDVPSMMVPPGLSSPARSASSIILTAMRSLIELPGLNVSSFARTVAFTSPLVMRLMRTIGVWPMASRIVSQIFFMALFPRPEQASHGHQLTEMVSVVIGDEQQLAEVGLPRAVRDLRE